MLEIQENAVEHGFKHLETIAQLHHSKSVEDQLEAITIVLESFGLDGESCEQLIHCVDEFVPESRKFATGWVLMGFIAGLSTAQNASESF